MLFTALIAATTAAETISKNSSFDHYLPVITDIHAQLFMKPINFPPCDSEPVYVKFKMRWEDSWKTRYVLCGDDIEMFLLQKKRSKFNITVTKRLSSFFARK